MELQHLRYFQEAAEREHITKAARHLHITQPALSQVIAKLEAELEAPLFSREKKGIRLSDYGQVLLRYTKQIFSLLDNLKAELQDMKSSVSGHIALGTSFPVWAGHWLEDGVADFLERHEEVWVNVQNCPQRELRRLLLEGELDMAVTSIPIRDEAIEWMHLFDEPMGVWLSCEHPLARESSISLPSLAGEVFYYGDDKTDIAELTEQLCRRAGFEARLLPQGSFAAILERAILQNRGVSLVPASVSREACGPMRLPEGTLFLPLREEYCCRNCGIAVRRGQYMTNAAALLAEELLQIGRAQL